MRCAILIAIACIAATSASFEEVPEEILVERPLQVSAMAKQVFTEAELSAKGPYWKWTDKFKTKDDGKYRLREQFSSKKKVTKQEWTLIEAAKQTKATPKK